MIPKNLNSTGQGSIALHSTLCHFLERHRALYLFYSLKPLKHRDGKATILDLSTQKPPIQFCDFYSSGVKLGLKKKLTHIQKQAG